MPKKIGHSFPLPLPLRKRETCFRDEEDIPRFPLQTGGSSVSAAKGEGGLRRTEHPADDRAVPCNG
jgi:hypothetical protein